MYSKTQFAKKVVKNVQDAVGEGTFSIHSSDSKNYVALNMSGSSSRFNIVLQRITEQIRELGGDPSDFNINVRENSIIVASTGRFSLNNAQTDIESIKNNKDKLMLYLEQLGEEMLRTKCTR